jgi:protein O-GlcNAc transferase
MIQQPSMQIALEHHRAGRLAEAERMYRQVLSQEPNHPAALHLLGAIAKQTGQGAIAVELMERAVRLKPDYVEAHYNLAIALVDVGQFDRAIHSFQRAIELRPDYGLAYLGLGNALLHKDQIDAAIDAYHHAIRLQPDSVEALSNLGSALLKKGDLEGSVNAFRRAIQVKPDCAEVFNNLAGALKTQGDLDQATQSYRQAIELKPEYAEAHFNLGIVFGVTGQVDEAGDSYRRAIQLAPNNARAFNNFGLALRSKGQLVEASEAFERAIALDARYLEAHSNLLYTLNFDPACDAGTIAEKHRQWNRRFAEPMTKFIHAPRRKRGRGERLRIGYVSPDFRDQAESFFTVPLLANHDHAKFEIFCYSSVIQSDAITARLRQYADVWRDVRTETDEALTEIIHRDQIDILVDLTMHMSGSRALVFARKPAPVQACWLAYPGTTGLTAMDYRITDSIMDPLDGDDSCYSEKSIRLPDCWVVYDPLIELSPRAAEQAGPVTFGSLNNPAKLNEPLLSLWGSLLRAVPESRFLLQVKSLEHRRRISRLMETHGVETDRLDFVGWMDRPEYLRTYDRIDIAVDPLPYNGITTTCDALFMGTPVLTLAGNTAAGRAGKAMLSAIGLKELIAHSPEEFVQIGARLAQDIPRLVELRRTLRARLKASPLMDGPRFARNLESSYWKMWEEYANAG